MKYNWLHTWSSHGIRRSLLFIFWWKIDFESYRNIADIYMANVQHEKKLNNFCIIKMHSIPLLLTSSFCSRIEFQRREKRLQKNQQQPQNFVLFRWIDPRDTSRIRTTDRTYTTTTQTKKLKTPFNAEHLYARARSLHE